MTEPTEPTEPTDTEIQTAIDQARTALAALACMRRSGETPETLARRDRQINVLARLLTDLTAAQTQRPATFGIGVADDAEVDAAVNSLTLDPHD